MRFWFILLAISLLTFSSALAQEAEATHADWLHYGGTQFSWRYSALDQINTNNVKNLTPAWIFQTGDYAENLQTTPMVDGGMMYLITRAPACSRSMRPRESEIWRYSYARPRAHSGQRSYVVQNRGLAVGDGKVLFGTNDNNVVALDSGTGRERWRVAVDDPRQCGCNIGAAPLIVKDKVIVGGNSGDGAHRGYLTAFL